MGRLRQAAREFADSTLMAARPLRWAVRVYSTTGRETTGLVEVERIVLGGGDRFWVQVRNSVYLADDDLIWIIKDTGAQGNWTFAGFVEGGGTGESPADSPIPSVAAPVYTAPDNTPVVIRPPAGEDMTLGRVGETIDVAGGLTVAEGITFSNLGAGIVQTSAAGVLSSDYTIDATMTMATATNIVPTDASGQDLGDATHRWDLYAQDVIFGGVTGTNVVTVPDNLADAWHLSDAGGIEYMRIVSTNAQPVIHFNQGEVDIDTIISANGVTNALIIWGNEAGLIGVGGKAGGTNPNYLGIFGNRAVNPAVSADGFCIYAGYTGGTTGGVRGGYLAATIADVGAGDYNIFEGFSGEVYTGLLLNDGAASAVVNWTGTLTTAYGVHGIVGNISGSTGLIVHAQGVNGGVFNWGASSRIRNAYGVRVAAVQATGTDAGQTHNAYGLYIEDNITASGGATNNAWAIYSLATEDSYLAGKLGLGTTPDTRLDIGAGAIELDEMAAPGAGAANTGRLYLVDNAGKTELRAIFATGASQLIAAQP